MAEVKKCQALVLHRDTYRRTGRGPTGFEMHYSQERCERTVKDNGLCWQHVKQPNVSRVKYP